MVISKLAEIQTASTNRSHYKSLIKRLYPELYVSVSRLTEGDLKTDLSTAVYLFEKAYLREQEADEAPADCDLEIRNVYKSICLERIGQSRAQVLKAKALLHTTWASAHLRYFRGDRGDWTISTLSELASERSIDIKLARRLVSLLSTLDKNVNTYSSLAHFEERNAVAGVSFDKMSRDFRSVAPAAYALLSALPRNSLAYHLQNALNSYGDGLFWWEKTYRQREMVVSVNNWTEPPPKNPLGFDAAGINYTVVTQWKKAGKHITSAAVQIENTGTDASIRFR